MWLRNNLIFFVMRYTLCLFGKSACSFFVYLFMENELFRSNRSFAFFGAQLRLRAFYFTKKAKEKEYEVKKIDSGGDNGSFGVITDGLRKR